MKNLWEKLENYSNTDYYPYHMPGHKRFPKNEENALACYKRFPKNEENALACYKRFPKNEENALACYKRFPKDKENTPACYKSLWDIYRHDITEIDGFDNLHDAKGLLLELQRRAACIYHAEQSFFLINGSTGGILSAVSAASQDGKKLLAARNCHKSVYNGIELNRLQAEYLWPDMIDAYDIQGEITAEQITAHLAGRQDICAVVITSPTYDGIISDIEKISEAVHACGIPLIVDEAHGAHLALSEKAPKGAAECGADIVINSVHKTLPAPTQTALLHVQGKLIDRERLKRYLGIYQSSSPSYLLMAGIDLCMDYIAEQGQEAYERLLMLRRQIDAGASKFFCIRIMPAGDRRDAGKLVISVKGTDMTGQELYRILLRQYHIQMEMAAPSYVLGILTAMDSEEGVQRLLNALAEVDQKLFLKRKRSEDAKKSELKKAEVKRTGIKKAELKKEEIKETDGAADMYHMIPVVSGLSIYEASRKETEWVLPEEAAGRISGGFLYFYPPGIPLVVPGEIVSRELVLKIEQIKKRSEYLTGLSEEGKVQVLVENEKVCG